MNARSNTAVPRSADIVSGDSSFANWLWAVAAL